MRLSKKSARILAASLAISLSITMAGCSDAPASSAPASSSKPASSSASSSSVASSTPTASNTTNSASSGKSQDFSIYPLADPSLMIHVDGYKYVFKKTDSGEIEQLGSALTEVLPKDPPIYNVYVDAVPFDWFVSTYVWDGQNFRCKKKVDFNPISSDKMEYKKGYKFVFNYSESTRSISGMETATDPNTGTYYIGWIPDNLVEQATTDKKCVAVTDCFPKGAIFENSNMLKSGYYWFKNNFYFHR